MSLLSLILGGAGLLLVLLGSGFGILLGIAGLICGIIALERGGSKTISILGIVFGGIITLLSLLLLVALSAIYVPI